MNRQFTIGIVVIALALIVGAPGLPADKKITKGNGRDLIKTDELKGWLKYLSSDELEGRSTFSEGLGLAAAYIAGELKSASVKPIGDNGSYFQRVAVKGVKSTNRSTVIVEVNGEKRTFKDAEAVIFPKNVGGKRIFSSTEVEFVGYGLNAPQANHNDYQGRSVKNKIVIWLGSQGPKNLDQSARRLLFGRARYATEQEGAIASIGPASQFGGGRRGQEAPAAAPSAAAPSAPGAAQAGPPGGFGAQTLERPDFTTVQRLDNPVAPTITAQDAFFEFLFSASDIKYAELKDKAAKQESLPSFTIRNVKITFDLDATYEIVRTQYTRNVVGSVEGSDTKLKDTYVAFGAHYDHVGYAEGEVRETANGPRRQGAVGRVKDGALEDRFWNGADDDASGCVTLLAVAKAFSLGPRPKRSLIFVFHTGEERGLWGSRYYADYPSVPIEKTVAEFNLDMVGRNRDDKAEENNRLYLIGSDRISTELHNLTVDANASLPKPLTLDYELNDPADPEQFYYRSDHYSYAVKGIPIVFLTSGLQPDYHFNTDSIEKINFDKLTRVSQLVYEAGRKTADLNHAPERDNKGPRVGKGYTGKLNF